MKKVFVLSTFCLLVSYLFAQNLTNPCQLAEAAEKIVDATIRYDPSYVRIPYPNGDVDPKTGVCTDVVIRAYRQLGVDLQKEVHEDVINNFDKYPIRRIWKKTEADANIDHRRVPNLMVFFTRHGEVLKITDNGLDYQSGDLVCWDLGGGILHIGIVSRKATNSDRYMIIHNIGGGQVYADCLFDWRVIGHYRYLGGRK